MSERTLYFMRHGNASSLTPGGDRQRPLTGRGRREAHEMGDVLVRRGADPELVLVSNALRTRETWRQVNAAGVDPATVVATQELYDASGREVVSLLQRVRPDIASVLVIAHFPGMPEAIELVSQGRGDQRALERMQFGYPTAGLATIRLQGEWADLPDAGGELLRFDFPVR